MAKPYTIVFLFLLNLFSLSIYAQNDMLIKQLSNRLVVRENFDKSKNLINKQIFNVGKVIKTKDYLEIDVVTELFDNNGKITDKYSTVYRCKPNESSIMVMILPFSKLNSKKTKINSISKNFKELYNLNNLEDVEMQINFDSGLLDFFGSKSKIKMYDRVLESNGIANVIKSKLNAKAYALGLRIKQYNYIVTEKLSLEGFLTFQKFKEEDGSYFTMTYK